MPWIPNPEPYEWGPREKNPQGIPFLKDRAAVLERDGKRKKFTNQDDLNHAWATGWHDFGRPETADVIWEDEPEPEVVEPEPEMEMNMIPKPGKHWSHMNKEDLIEYGDLLKVYGAALDLDPDMLKDDMLELVKAAYHDLTKDEEGEE